MDERMLQVLAGMKRALRESVAFGLPDFTNEGGTFCSEACLTHACSIGCMLDVAYDHTLYPEEELIDWGTDDAME
jgi:hypothetical protein